jgi:hypothetical protein
LLPAFRVGTYKVSGLLVNNFYKHSA